MDRLTDQLRCRGPDAPDRIRERRSHNGGLNHTAMRLALSRSDRGRGNLEPDERVVGETTIVGNVVRWRRVVTLGSKE
jgi:hypothetical protein